MAGELCSCLATQNPLLRSLPCMPGGKAAAWSAHAQHTCSACYVHTWATVTMSCGGRYHAWAWPQHPAKQHILSLPHTTGIAGRQTDSTHLAAPPAAASPAQPRLPTPCTTIELTQDNAHTRHGAHTYPCEEPLSPLCSRHMRPPAGLTVHCHMAHSCTHCFVFLHRPAVCAATAMPYTVSEGLPHTCAADPTCQTWTSVSCLPPPTAVCILVPCPICTLEQHSLCIPQAHRGLSYNSVGCLSTLCLVLWSHPQLP
jgi:hypothetical protein